MADKKEIPIEIYEKANEICNKLVIEKPWIAIHEAEDGTVTVTDSDGNSCAFCDWEGADTVELPVKP